MNRQEAKHKLILKCIPISVNDTDILLYLHGKKVFGSMQKFDQW